MVGWFYNNGQRRERSAHAVRRAARLLLKSAEVERKEYESHKNIYNCAKTPRERSRRRLYSARES